MIPETETLILLVDDDPNDQELARVALSETLIPHRLVVKRDGAEVLEWLASLTDDENEWPNLIVLDLKLPKVNGLEVLKALRSERRTKYVPIVVFTSSAEIRDLDQSYALGANAYIRKPIDFAIYRETIGDIGRFWILRNRRAPRTLGQQQ